jgi:outer membrane protein assembly factor BamB
MQFRDAFYIPAILCLATAHARAQDLPPNHDQHSSFLSSQVIAADPETFPLRWSPDHVRWSRPLDGYGQSAPVVWQGKAYITSVVGDNKDHCLLTAVNCTTGEVIWQHREDSEVLAESTPMISRAAPTPACDSEGVYAFFETGNLIALTHTGQVRWQRKLQEELGTFQNKFGLSASAAQTDDAIYILIDHEGESSLLAIEKSTGVTRWRTMRAKHGHSWTSPAIVLVNEKPVLVCSSIGSVDAYDWSDGKLLATMDSVGGNSVATPIDCGEGRFLVSSLIRPADGPVEGATRSNLLARLTQQDGKYSIQVDWIAKEARGSFSSPLVHGDYCYWINPQGVLYCLDSKTGEEFYAKRLDCGGCWASPIAIGDRLYCFGRDGEAVVIRIDKEYQELSSGNRVWPEQPVAPDQAPDRQPPGYTARPGIYAAIAFEGAFLLRSGNALYRVDGDTSQP